MEFIILLNIFIIKGFDIRSICICYMGQLASIVTQFFVFWIFLYNYCIGNRMSAFSQFFCNQNLILMVIFLNIHLNKNNYHILVNVH